MVRLVVGEDAARKLDNISVSNDTVSRRINKISLNIKEQVVDEIKKSPLFAIQLDESTDVSQFSQLLAFVRHVHEGNFKEEFLFCKPLKLNTRAEDVLEAVNDFFNENGLDRGNLVGITTGGAPTMLGCCCCCCCLPDPFRGMEAWRKTMETQKPGNSPGSGPEVVKRQRVAKERAAQRVRSWTVQNEMRDVLGRVSTGAARRVLDSANPGEIGT